MNKTDVDVPWRTPGFFAEGCLPPHSGHTCYPDRAAARRGQERNSLRCSLNGVWRFHYARNPAQTVPGFWTEEFDCGGWEYIRVPGHIQLQGHGRPQYVNVQYPWDGREAVPRGRAPERENPVGSYVRTFRLPKEMEGMRVCISFQGVESAFALWLNGHYVGCAADSFAAHDFELTEHLRPGENRLAVRVWQWNPGSWLEDQDFFRFSGIYRDVYLYACPAVHLRDLALRPALSDDFGTGTLGVRCALEGGPWRVEAVLSRRGEELHRETFSGDGAELSFSWQVERPDLWSAEAPNLYDLELTLFDAAGRVTEYVPETLGFRRFELRDGLMRLNGKRIVFCGVNRHDFTCDRGRAVTEQEIERDLITMKRNNINAVRTSHYTNSQVLYDLCDRLGLYVLAENNLESHGTWSLPESGPALPGDDETWLPLLLDRVERTYHREKNHPSILIWSCGNESFGGRVIWEMSQRFRALDDSRLVHYEGIFHDRRYPDTSDMESQMYPSVAAIRTFLRERPEKPFLCCEYSHAMGNSCGGMHHYTRLAEEEPRYQGGFLWDFIDQTLRTRDPFGRETLAYGGDFGERPTDGNFSGNGLCFGDGSESPKMQEVKYNYQPIRITVTGDRAEVWNKQLFTGTEVYDARLTVARDGAEIARVDLDPISAPPLGRAEIALSLPDCSEPGEWAATLSFHLRQDTAWAPRGHEVAFGQGVWRVDAPAQSLPAGTLELVEGDFNLGVRGEGFDCLFCRATGELISYRWAGRELLREPPRPNFWRAPTDNDRGYRFGRQLGVWKLASEYAAAEDSCRVERGADWVRVAGTYRLPGVEAECAFSYTVLADGTVRVALDWPGKEGLPPMPEFGMLLQTDADFSQLDWYGRGPAECYRDRDQGARLGIWHSTVTGEVTPYPRPQECGSRTGVRWMSVTDRRGHGLRLEGEGMECSALPYTPAQLEPAAHHWELPPVFQTVLRPAAARMGVGGDDSWGAWPLEEYRLPAGVPRRFCFSLRGL